MSPLSLPPSVCVPPSYVRLRVLELCHPGPCPVHCDVRDCRVSGKLHPVVIVFAVIVTAPWTAVVPVNERLDAAVRRQTRPRRSAGVVAPRWSSAGAGSSAQPKTATDDPAEDVDDGHRC